MKQFLVLAALVAVAASTALDGGLRITFGSRDTSAIGTSYLFDIPRSVSAAETAGWTLTTRPSGPLSSLTLYCAENRTICTLYESDTGYVAGLQIALETSEFTDSVLDWETQGFTSWTPSDDGKTYWTIQQYFVNEDYLAKTADERTSSYNSSKTLQLDAVWVTAFNQELFEMSTTESDLVASSFVKQICASWMGYHYYYNMSTSLTCAADTLFPWFGMVDADELIATGIILYGQQATNSVREWLERQTRAVVAYVIPLAPTCMLDLIDDPGMINMHIFYVDQPQLITCG